MEALGNLIFLTAVFSPLIAVYVSVTFYPDFAARYRADTRSSKPLGRFIGGILLYGVGVGLFGLMLGIPAFCALLPSAQCGFGGIFIAGPLGFSAGVALFVYTSLRRAPAP